MIVRYKTSKIKLKDEEFYYLVQNSVIENHILKEIKSINQMIIDFISNNYEIPVSFIIKEIESKDKINVNGIVLNLSWSLFYDVGRKYELNKNELFQYYKDLLLGEDGLTRSVATNNFEKVLIKEVHIYPNKFIRFFTDLEINFPEIKINKNGNFFIGDTELRFSPREKVLYWLFLENPKGIKLKDIYEYEKDISDKYKKSFTVSDLDNDNASKTINRLLESETLNEIRTRVNKEIKIKIPDFYKDYIISGNKGDNYYIKIVESYPEIYFK